MFELKQQCVIEHLNVRRGKNDESEVAIDIKLSCEDIPAKAIAGVLRAVNAEEVEKSFFADDEDRNRRFLGIGAIALEEEWEGKHMIKISSLSRMRVVKLAKVKLTPRAKGLFDAVFRVTVEQPPENFIEAIADKIHRSVNVHLEQDVRELDLPQGEKPADAAKKPGRPRKLQAEDVQPALH